MSFIELVGTQAQENVVVLSVLKDTPDGNYEVQSQVLSPDPSKLIGMTARGYFTAVGAVNLNTIFGVGSILAMVKAAVGAASVYVSTRSFGTVPAAAVEAADGRIDPVRAKPYLVPATAQGQQILGFSSSGGGLPVVGYSSLPSPGIAGMSLSTIAIIAFVAWLVLKK